MASDSGNGDVVEGSVELAISTPVESVTVLGLRGRDRDRGDTAEPGASGFVAATTGV